MHTSFSNLCFFKKTTFAFFFFKQDLARNCDLTDVKLSWAQLWHTFMISMLGRQEQEDDEFKACPGYVDSLFKKKKKKRTGEMAHKLRTWTAASPEFTCQQSTLGSSQIASSRISVPSEGPCTCTQSYITPVSPPPNGVFLICLCTMYIANWCCL